MSWVESAVLHPFGSVEAFVEAGGWILPWIMVAALILWALLIERYWYLWRIYPAEVALRLAEWSARRERRSWYARRVREAMLSELEVKLGLTLPLIRVIVPGAPLLGLLGTVTGMLEVFDALSQQGVTDVRAMAYGVSHAMVATLAGLVVSLNALFFSTQLSARVRVERERLKELFLAEAPAAG